MVKKVAILSLIGLFGLVTSAFSLSYTTVAGDKSPFPGIGFSLSITDNAGNEQFPYHATFTITTPGDSALPTWRIGWFVLQFDASTPAVIDPLSPPTVPTNTGTWGILATSTSLPWNGGSTISPANAGKSGLYLINMPDSQSESWEDMGVLVSTGGPYTFEFNFEEASTLADTVNFQVGFYSDVWKRTGPPGSVMGYYQTTQLSETLTTIPEPSTLLLLGAGLVGFGILGRRKFRS